MTDAKTLSDLLRAPEAAEHQLHFVPAPGEHTSMTAAELRERALRRLAAFDAPAGTEVVMPIADPEVFLETFWMSILGGHVPMPLAPPTNDATCAKIVDILGSRAHARLVIDEAGAERLRKAGAPDEFLARRVWPEPAAEPASEVERTPDDIAFVQYSSGSTRAPKGVIVRHGQALANLAAIRAGAELGRADRTLSWMPLSHDMGLVGFHLAPLSAFAAEQTILPTSLFARSPLVWLQEASTRRSTILSSPNFGYRHALKSIDRKGVPDGVDLSSVRLVLNGAEPISVDLAEEFLERLGAVGLAPESMFPVYGLAEATLAVTFPELGRRIGGLRVARASLGRGETAEVTESTDDSLVTAGCGRPLPGLEVRIAGEDGFEAPGGVVGAIWIRGAGVTEGYYDDVAATSAAVKGEGWLDTGDLGFVKDGELYVAGRSKELVIVDGQNFYPHDLEESLCAALGLDPLRVAVAPVRRGSDPEELGVFVQHRGEPDAFAETARAVKEHVARTFGVSPAYVLPVAQVPRTTSGKAQRGKLAAALIAGDLDDALRVLSPELLAPAPAASGESAAEQDTSPEALETMMLGFCDEVLDGLRFGPEDNLFEQGMSSIDLAEIHGLIEARFPGGLDIRDFFDAPTVRALSVILSERASSGAVESKG
ncbi:MAG: non-ribosomal peptide synthetase [Planctomycetota bacterium]